MELKIITPSSADAEAMDVLNRQAFPDNERLDTDDLFLYAKDESISIKKPIKNKAATTITILRNIFHKLLFIPHDLL